MEGETLHCGDACRGGNISMWFKGACKKPVEALDAYRCTGCSAFFHRDCIFDHFELEEAHSVSHRALRKIKDAIIYGKPRPEDILKLAQEGLDRTKQKVPIFPLSTLGPKS